MGIKLYNKLPSHSNNLDKTTFQKETKTIFHIFHSMHYMMAIQQVRFRILFLLKRFLR